MNIKLIFSIFAVTLALVGANAQALTITPSTSGVIAANLGQSNCEAGCVYNAFGLTNDGTLDLLYKGAVGNIDEGTFAASYNTVFANTESDPSDATITHIAGLSIVCPECYLAIKDGNQNPSYYFYNLSSWNGTETIELRDFWPEQGAISHVSIWGREGITPPTGTAPEPSLIALLGLGLLGFGTTQLRKSRQS